MSITAHFDRSGEAGVVADFAGWDALHEWLDSIPVEACQRLEELTACGEAEGLAELETEMKDLLRNHGPPPGVDKTLKGLLRMLKNRSPEDGRLNIAGGVTDDDEDE